MVARVFSVGSDIVLYPFLVSENGRVPEPPLPQGPD
jgi:hypothetical protein